MFMADAIHFSLMPAPLLHPRRHQCLSNHDVLYLANLQVSSRLFKMAEYVVIF